MRSWREWHCRWCRHTSRREVKYVKYSGDHESLDSKARRARCTRCGRRGYCQITEDRKVYAPPMPYPLPPKVPPTYTEVPGTWRRGVDGRDHFVDEVPVVQEPFRKIRFIGDDLF